MNMNNIIESLTDNNNLTYKILEQNTIILQIKHNLMYMYLTVNNNVVTKCSCHAVGSNVRNERINHNKLISEITNYNGDNISNYLYDKYMILLFREL